MSKDAEHSAEHQNYGRSERGGGSSVINMLHRQE